MRITRQSRYAAQQLFLNCLAGGRLDEDRVRGTVTTLIAQRPRHCLAMLSHFQQLVKLDLARRAVSIESAVPLPAAARGQIETGLAKKYGDNLNITYSERPALIGGLRIRVGSDVIDGSVRHRLDNLLTILSEP